MQTALRFPVSLKKSEEMHKKKTPDHNEEDPTIDSLIVRYSRSGGHLPFYGVAVVSKVLCTSATLNKRKHIVQFCLLMKVR